MADEAGSHFSRQDLVRRGAAVGVAAPTLSFLLGAGKLGLTQLASLSELPPTGAMLIVAPLKIVKGSGSPCRALALVPA